MTRKDYVATARVFATERARRLSATDTEWASEELADTVEAATMAAVATVDRMAAHMADVFEADNPRFDRDRFLTACKEPRPVHGGRGTSLLPPSGE